MTFSDPRRDGLRDALAALRRARVQLHDGHLGWAVEDLRQAQAALSFTMGMFPELMDCTGGLRRAVFRFERRLVKLLEAAPVDPGELVELVAGAIRVLRTRDGLPVTDEMALERANNLVAGILGAYRVTVRPDNIVDCGQSN